MSGSKRCSAARPPRAFRPPPTSRALRYFPQANNPHFARADARADLEITAWDLCRQLERIGIKTLEIAGNAARRRRAAWAPAYTRPYLEAADEMHCMILLIAFVGVGLNSAGRVSGVEGVEGAGRPV